MFRLVQRMEDKSVQWWEFRLAHSELWLVIEWEKRMEVELVQWWEFRLAHSELRLANE